VPARGQPRPTPPCSLLLAFRAGGGGGHEPLRSCSCCFGSKAGLASPYKAAHNKAVNEAMELQVAGRGGSKRKYALADIKADIPSKRLFVRRGLPPPPWGGCPQPSPPTREGITLLTLALAPTPMGSKIRREDSDSSSTNSTDGTDLDHGAPWKVAQDRGGPRLGDEPRLDTLLGRFAGPDPLLVLCCIRLTLNDFSTGWPTPPLFSFWPAPRSSSSSPTAPGLFGYYSVFLAELAGSKPPSPNNAEGRLAFLALAAGSGPSAIPGSLGRRPGAPSPRAAPAPRPPPVFSQFLVYNFQ
jgi:hypothetical protein